MPGSSIERLHHVTDTREHDSGQTRSQRRTPRSSTLPNQPAFGDLERAPVVTNRLNRPSVRAPLPTHPSGALGADATVPRTTPSRSSSVRSMASDSADSFGAGRSSWDSRRPLLDVHREPEDFYRSASPSPNREYAPAPNRSMSAASERPVERDVTRVHPDNAPPANLPPANVPLGHAPVADRQALQPHPGALPHPNHSVGSSMNPLNSASPMMNSMNSYGYGPMGRFQQIFGIGMGIVDAILMVGSAFSQLIKSWAAKIEQAAAPVR